MAMIQVNGKPEEVKEGLSLLQLLQQKGFDPALVSVEHNGRIVDREEWDATKLHGDDEVEQSPPLFPVYGADRGFLRTERHWKPVQDPISARKDVAPSGIFPPR